MEADHNGDLLAEILNKVLADLQKVENIPPADLELKISAYCEN